MNNAKTGTLVAGVAKTDITDYSAGRVNDPLFAKALVLRNAETTAVIVTVDAVALAEIGPIRKEVLETVRRQLSETLGIEPANLLVGASHCHGSVCPNVAELIVGVVTEAWNSTIPVAVGCAKGVEERITENRRFRLRNEREADARRAYSLPPDAEVVGVGPIDPEIGIIRLNRLDGRPLAVIYSFACHPIKGVPSGGNTADITGFASTAIEQSLGGDTMALFLQGCGGDINPIRYKDVGHPNDAETLGAMLGLSVLKALDGIACVEGPSLIVLNEALALPRADLSAAISRARTEEARLLGSLTATDLNLRSFLELVLRSGIAPDYPSYHAHLYLHEAAIGHEDLRGLDAQNRKRLTAYLRNIHSMEELTRVRTNARLLEMHQTQNVAAGSNSVDVEIMGIRIGDCSIITFPGELSVQIGLNIKDAAPAEHTIVATCANGYIYYAPTARQLENRGGAQEDSDCILAPEWQELFEARAMHLLGHLEAHA